MSCELDGRRDMDWFEKCPLPCLWYGKLGSGVVKQKSHLGLCGSTAKPKSRSPTPLPSSGPEWLRSGDRFKVQGPASGPGGRFHRSSRFVFLISPLPAGHPDCRQPTPRGISFLFLNRGRPIWGSDLQQIRRQAFIASVKHKTSQLPRAFQCSPSIARPAAACGIVLLHNPNSPGHCGRGDVGNATPAWLGLC